MGTPFPTPPTAFPTPAPTAPTTWATSSPTETTTPCGVVFNSSYYSYSRRRNSPYLKKDALKAAVTLPDGYLIRGGSLNTSKCRTSEVVDWCKQTFGCCEISNLLWGNPNWFQEFPTPICLEKFKKARTEKR